jgi:hypothetical protein
MTLADRIPPIAAKPEYPLLAVRPREDKLGWYVEAWWTSRPSENIGHFTTQSDARNWITLESASYFVLREIESMISDLLPNLPSFIRRVCSSCAPEGGVLRTRLG